MRTQGKTVAAVLGLLLASACKPEVENRAASFRQSQPGPIPAYTQRNGDAEAGRHALLHAPIVDCGVPYSAFAQLQSPDVITLPDRQGKAAELPYSFNLLRDENNVEIVAGNCLICHGASLFGELVIGLGNEFMDFTVDASVAVERSGALVSGSAEIRAFEKYADRVAAIAPYMRMRTAGTNPANNLTFALMAHRDANSNEWSSELLHKAPPTEVPPVSVPPWWRMRKKNAMFSMGEGRGDHARMMMAAAILCTDTREQLQALDAIAPDVRAFISSLEPPPYPFPVDAELAGHGRQLFEQNCSACHGHYGEPATYPNHLVELEIIGTDAALIDYAFGDGKTWVEWFNGSFFGETAFASPARGYVAPPLDGIWSTAPFLHNGSVPTLRAVLDSNSRPRKWRHKDPRSLRENYLPADLGWRYVDIDQDPLAAEDVGLQRWIHDTSAPGHGNQGHRFGDALSGAERDAVLEYLKTL